MSFPSSPSVGQQVTEGGRLYSWDGYAWSLVSNVSAHAATHAANGSDPLTLTSNQISDFATAAAAAAPATTNASLLTSGTLADARLTANVVLTTDGRLSDSRSPTPHAASHASGGTDELTLQSSQVTGLAAVATSGSASSLLSGTLADARLSANVVTTSVLAYRHHQTTSFLDVLDRACVNRLDALISGAIYWTFFTPTYSLTASQIAVATSTASTTVTAARMGLYTVDGSGTCTLVARTASDTTLFTAANTVFTRSFDTTGGYPATYSLAAGTRYACAVFASGTGLSSLFSSYIPNPIALLSPRMHGSRTANADLVSSQTNAQFNGAPFFAYWFRLS